MHKKIISLFLLAAFAGGVAAQSHEMPGRRLSGAEAVPNPAIPPDGRGLPPGSGTVAEGRKVYEAQCAMCHGARGEGMDIFPPLVGGIGSLGTKKPFPTIGAFWPYATTIWDYINRAMPYQAAGTMKPNEVYAVTAYLLHLNGIVGADHKLDAKSLPKVKMPNRDGFVDDPRPDL